MKRGISAPQLQFVRYRGKIHIQRPRAPCYEKARLIAATRPIFAPKPYNQVCIQDQIRRQQRKTEKIAHPYEIIIAREVRNWLDQSKMIAMFHVNPINAEDHFNARVAFHKQGMALKEYGKSVMKLAIDESKYEAILPLFDTRTAIVFSPELKIAQMLKICKKIPQLIFLAGIAEDRYLSKNEFENLAAMSNIQNVRAQFAAVLDNAAGRLVSDLQAHQMQLCSLLDIHAKGQQESLNTESEPENTSSEQTKPDN